MMSVATFGTRFGVLDVLKQDEESVVGWAVDGDRGRRILVRRLRDVFRDDLDAFERLKVEVAYTDRLDSERCPRAMMVPGEEPYLEYAHAPGVSLERLLETLDATGRSLTPAAATVLVSELLHAAKAIQRIRARTIPGVSVWGHGEIEPASIVLDVDGVARIADVRFAATGMRADPTPIGGLCRPEELGPDAVAGTPAGDVYSVGAVLALCVLGARRLIQADEETLIRSVSKELSERRDEIDDGFGFVLTTALAQRPRERFENCNVMRIALRQCAFLSSEVWRAQLDGLAAMVQALNTDEPPREIPEHIFDRFVDLTMINDAPEPTFAGVSPLAADTESVTLDEADQDVIDAMGALGLPTPSSGMPTVDGQLNRHGLAALDAAETSQLSRGDDTTIDAMADVAKAAELAALAAEVRAQTQAVEAAASDSHLGPADVYDRAGSFDDPAETGPELQALDGDIASRLPAFDYPPEPEPEPAEGRPAGMTTRPVPEADMVVGELITDPQVIEADGVRDLSPLAEEAEADAWGVAPEWSEDSVAGARLDDDDSPPTLLDAMGIVDDPSEVAALEAATPVPDEFAEDVPSTMREARALDDEVLESAQADGVAIVDDTEAVFTSFDDRSVVAVASDAFGAGEPEAADADEDEVAALETSSADDEELVASSADDELAASSADEELVASSEDEELAASSADEDAIAASSADEDAIAASSADEDAIAASSADEDALAASSDDDELAASSDDEDATIAASSDEDALAASEDDDALAASSDEDALAASSDEDALAASEDDDALAASEDDDATIAAAEDDDATIAAASEDDDATIAAASEDDDATIAAASEDDDPTTATTSEELAAAASSDDSAAGVGVAAAAAAAIGVAASLANDDAPATMREAEALDEPEGDDTLAMLDGDTMSMLDADTGSDVAAASAVAAPVDGDKSVFSELIASSKEDAPLDKRGDSLVRAWASEIDEQSQDVLQQDENAEPTAVVHVGAEPTRELVREDVEAAVAAQHSRAAEIDGLPTADEDDVLDADDSRASVPVLPVAVASSVAPTPAAGFEWEASVPTMEAVIPTGVGPAPERPEGREERFDTEDGDEGEIAAQLFGKAGVEEVPEGVLALTKRLRSNVQEDSVVVPLPGSVAQPEGEFDDGTSEFSTRARAMSTVGANPMVPSLTERIPDLATGPLLAEALGDGSQEVVLPEAPRPPPRRRPSTIRRPVIERNVTQVGHTGSHHVGVGEQRLLEVGRPAMGQAETASLLELDPVAQPSIELAHAPQRPSSIPSRPATLVGVPRPSSRPPPRFESDSSGGRLAFLALTAVVLAVGLLVRAANDRGAEIGAVVGITDMPAMNANRQVPARITASADPLRIDREPVSAEEAWNLPVAMAGVAPIEDAANERAARLAFGDSDPMDAAGGWQSGNTEALGTWRFDDVAAEQAARLAAAGSASESVWNADDIADLEDYGQSIPDTSQEDGFGGAADPRTSLAASPYIWGGPVSHGPRAGRLIVNVIPWGNVFVDGRPYGYPPVVVRGLRAGPHSIRVERPGFETTEQVVRLEAKEDKSVHVRFRRVGED